MAGVIRCTTSSMRQSSRLMSVTCRLSTWISRRSSANARASASLPPNTSSSKASIRRLDRLHRLEIGVHRAVEHLGEQVGLEPSLPALAARLGSSFGLERREPLLLGPVDGDEERGRRRRSRPSGSAPGRWRRSPPTRSSKARMMMKVWPSNCSNLGRCSGSRQSFTAMAVQPVRPGELARAPRPSGSRRRATPAAARCARARVRTVMPRQIRLAAAAAPNPLSMLTTVTPAAHELSMPSSAASPPNEAP